MDLDLFITLGIILLAVAYLVVHLHKKKGCGCDGCSCATRDAGCSQEMSKIPYSCENSKKQTQT